MQNKCNIYVKTRNKHVSHTIQMQKNAAHVQIQAIIVSIIHNKHKTNATYMQIQTISM